MEVWQACGSPNLEEDALVLKALLNVIAGTGPGAYLLSKLGLV